MRLLLPLLLLLALPARAEGLKVATWNLDWLTLRPAGDPSLPAEVRPRDERDFAELRRYAERLDADVVAFQEVDGAEAAARVFPPDRYDLVVTGDRAVQRVGFAIRHGLHWTREPDLQALDLYPDARFPLRSGADVVLDLPGGRLRLLAVHLKTGCWDAALESPRRACEELRQQLAPLTGWVAARAAEGAPFLLLGDFNRRMDGTEEMLTALERAAPLARAEAGHASPCWGGEGFIDHILAGGAARGWMQPDTLRVLTYRETDPALKDRLSDHCPVSVRLELPAGR